MDSFIYGLMLSGGIIVAIGAQNIHVIRNGIAKNNTFTIAATCFLCDVLLMFFGVFFVGSITKTNMALTLSISILATAFLLYYGYLYFKKSFSNNGKSTHIIFSIQRTSKLNAILTTLAITLLNPHVYLDTFIIIGGVSSTLNVQEKLCFIAGALLASFSWFLCLGYFAKKLAHFFNTPAAWKYLDFCIGIFMWILAASMILFIIENIYQ